MGTPSPETIDSTLAAARAKPGVFIATAIICLGAGFGAATLLTQERVATIEAQRDSAIREIDKLTKSISEIDAQARELGAQLDRARQAGFAAPAGNGGSGPVSDVATSPAQPSIIDPPDDGVWKKKMTAPMANSPAPRG